MAPKRQHAFPWGSTAPAEHLEHIAERTHQVVDEAHAAARDRFEKSLPTLVGCCDDTDVLLRHCLQDPALAEASSLVNGARTRLAGPFETASDIFAAVGQAISLLDDAFDIARTSLQPHGPTHVPARTALEADDRTAWQRALTEPPPERPQPAASADPDADPPRRRRKPAVNHYPWGIIPPRKRLRQLHSLADSRIATAAEPGYTHINKRVKSVARVCPRTTQLLDHLSVLGPAPTPKGEPGIEAKTIAAAIDNINDTGRDLVSASVYNIAERFDAMIIALRDGLELANKASQVGVHRRRMTARESFAMLGWNNVHHDIDDEQADKPLADTE